MCRSKKQDSRSRLFKRIDIWYVQGLPQVPYNLCYGSSTGDYGHYGLFQARDNRVVIWNMGVGWMSGSGFTFVHSKATTTVQNESYTIKLPNESERYSLSLGLAKTKYVYLCECVCVCYQDSTRTLGWILKKFCTTIFLRKIVVNFAKLFQKGCRFKIPLAHIYC